MAWKQYDLAALFRSRRWRLLLNLIDGLPRNSAYGEALACDRELAEALAEMPPNHSPLRRMVDYSPEVELLTDVVDRLAELAVVVAASSGAKVSRPPRAPRPVSMVEQLRREKRMSNHRALVARVLPAR